MTTKEEKKDAHIEMYALVNFSFRIRRSTYETFDI